MLSRNVFFISFSIQTGSGKVLDYIQIRRLLYVDTAVSQIPEVGETVKSWRGEALELFYHCDESFFLGVRMSQFF